MDYNNSSPACFVQDNSQETMIMNENNKIIKNEIINENKEIFYEFDSNINLTDEENALFTRLNNQYLGGLFDGDGSIYIAKIKDGYQLQVNFTQCYFPICKLLQVKYGGKIFKNLRRNENCRDYFSFRICGLKLKDLLNDLEEGCIMKLNQVKLAKKFMIMINKENTEEKHNIYLEIKKFNSNKDGLAEYKKHFEYDKINIDYICGLFDAEGYIGIQENENIYSLSQIQITQKSNNFILEEIRDFLKFGYVGSYSWRYFSNNDNYNDLLKIFYEKTIIKKNQLENVILFIDAKNLYKYINDDEELKEEYYNLMKECFINDKKEKHDNYEITCKYLTKLNLKFKYIEIEKEIELEKIRIEEDRKEKIIKKQLLSAHLSKMKMGPLNPNFGKIRPKEYCDKISKGTFGKHRSVTDEMIIEILKLKDTGIKQCEVAKNYNINRSVVSNIWNEILLPTNKYEEYKNNQKINKKEEIEKMVKEYYPEIATKELATIKTNLSKRILEGKYMVLIWYYGMIREKNVKTPFKKIQSTTLAKYINDKLGQEKISNDMIKNIWQFKTKLYKFDFQNNELNLKFENWENKSIDDIELKFVDFDF
jgi:hypothetical protein